MAALERFHFQTEDNQLISANKEFQDNDAYGVVEPFSFEPNWLTHISVRGFIIIVSNEEIKTSQPALFL